MIFGPHTRPCRKITARIGWSGNYYPWLDELRWYRSYWLNLYSKRSSNLVSCDTSRGKKVEFNYVLVIFQIITENLHWLKTDSLVLKYVIQWQNKEWLSGEYEKIDEIVNWKCPSLGENVGIVREQLILTSLRVVSLQCRLAAWRHCFTHHWNKHHLQLHPLQMPPWHQ